VSRQAGCLPRYRTCVLQAIMDCRPGCCTFLLHRSSAAWSWPSFRQARSPAEEDHSPERREAPSEGRERSERS
jgi:hypothetical protein